MATRAVAAGVAALLVSALCGCGTVLNLQGESQVYGGARNDARAGAGCLAQGLGLTRAEEHDKFSPQVNLAIGACALVDLPFSALADTLTLPVTIAAAFRCPGDVSTKSAPPTTPAPDSPPAETRLLTPSSR